MPFENIIAVCPLKARIWKSTNSQKMWVHVAFQDAKTIIGVWEFLHC